jgi:hypothetical protein
LQLIECIELLKNDVKKKMMMTRAIVACTKVTGDHHSRSFARKILSSGVLSGGSFPDDTSDRLIFSKTARCFS